MTLDYTNYDYDDIVISLQNRLKLSASWIDVGASGAGKTLIEFLAYILSQGLFYTERRATESYILTARNLSSVRNLVALLNYQPKRKSSATGTLTFTVSPSSKIVYIPKYTECQSVDGVKYITNEDAAIEKLGTSVAVKSIQGTLVQLENTSNGSLSQEYLINSEDVENSADATNPTLRVVVDGVEWTKVDSFIASDNDSKHYGVINEIEGTVTIQFGDNINGFAPGSGSVITIKYIKSSGLSGNVTNINQITTINSTIYDEDGAVVTVTVTNTGSFLGGDEAEDIEEIRYEAPRVFKTGDRAVSKTDFAAILENYPGVASANVWGENEEALAAGTPAVHEMLNKVKMSVILQEWELLDATFKDTLSSYIYDQSMLTVKYEFVDPVVLLVIPTLDIIVSTGYSMSQTQADVEEVLDDQFLLGTATKIGTMIKYSNVISAINDLDSVAYVNMTLEIKKSLDDGYDSYFDWGEILDATDILPESVRLFIDGAYVTKDSDNGDGTGSFTSAGIYTISGTIDYSTGEILLDISPAATSVFVRYQTDYDGNIQPAFCQICKLEEVDVQNISME